jgi:hypothetical protein
MMDPYFFDDDDSWDDGFDAGEEYVYDTYDSIINEDEVFGEEDSDRDENNYDYDWEIDGAEMGLMGALASEMSERSNRYDVDENTDRENWRRAAEATEFASRGQKGSNLRPFESYVQDYIRRGCRHPDD